MATQDEREFDFGQFALRTLTAAAAGSQANSIGGGFLAGVKSAQGFQDRDARQRKLAEQQKRQATADTRAEAKFNQETRRADQAFRINEDRSVQQKYDARNKRYQQFMAQGANKYNQKSTANMVNNNFGDGSDFVENPDEPEATSINDWAQYGNVMSAGDFLIQAVDVHESAADPRVKERAKQDIRWAAGKAGAIRHPATENSPEFFTLKGVDKPFPLTTQGARDLKSALNGRTTAFRKQLQNAFMTGESAESGALVSISSGIADAVNTAVKNGNADSHQLDDTEIGAVANTFTQWIKRDPQLTKAYTLANLVKRQVATKASGKNRDQELATGVATMKRYGVKVENLAGGQPTVDNDSFNAWMNRNEDSAKHVELLPAGGISKLDSKLADKLLDGMGINQQEQQLIAGAVSMNKQQGDQLRKDALGKIEAKTQEEIRKAENKDAIDIKRIKQQAQSLDSRLPIEQTLEHFVMTTSPARNGRPANKVALAHEPETLAAVQHLAEKRALVSATQGRNKLSNAKHKLYEERTGSTLEADLASGDTDRISFAKKVLSQELGVKIDQAKLDQHTRDILAGLGTAKGYRKFTHEIAKRKEAIQEKRVETERKAKLSKMNAAKLQPAGGQDTILQNIGGR